jgi:hypothetical protein
MMLLVEGQMPIIQMICQILMLMTQIDQVDHHIPIIHTPEVVAEAMAVAAVVIPTVLEMVVIIIKANQMLQINPEEIKVILTAI